MIERCLSPSNEIIKQIFDNYYSKTKKNPNTKCSSEGSQLVKRNFISVDSFDRISFFGSFVNNKGSKLKRFYNLFIKLAKLKVNKNKNFKKEMEYEKNKMENNIKDIERKYKRRIGNLKYQIIEIKKNINSEFNKLTYRKFFIKDTLLEIFYKNIGLLEFINNINETPKKLLEVNNNESDFIQSQDLDYIRKTAELRRILELINKEYRIQFRVLWELKRDCKLRYKERGDLIKRLVLNKIFIMYLNSNFKNILDLNTLKSWLSSYINIQSILSNIDKNNLLKEVINIENKIIMKSFDIKLDVKETEIIKKDYITFFNFHLNYWNTVGHKKFKNVNEYLLFLQDIWLS